MSHHEHAAMQHREPRPGLAGLIGEGLALSFSISMAAAGLLLVVGILLE